MATPPGTKTKAIFIDRQKKVLKRGSTPAAVKRCTEGWNRKGANGKQNWLNEHTLLVRQQERTETARARWHRAHQAYQEFLGLQRGVNYGIEFGRAHAEATVAARSARQAFNDLRTRYLNLRNLESQQPVPSAKSLIHSVVHVALCVNATNDYTDRLADLAGQRGGPLVPRDPSNGNNRRMPAHWYAGHHHQYLQARDHIAGLVPDLQSLVRQNVGLQHHGGLQWRPWVSASNPPTFGHLWLGFDQNEVVQDRVFRKDVFLTPVQFTDPRLEGDIRDPNQKRPFELTCHDELLRLPASYVVRMRGGMHGGLIDNNMLQYKVYLEWCRYGDLRSFIDRHAGPGGRQIPELMIWFVAEALATAGCAMEAGRGDDGAPTPGWEQIVHRDIKPKNVFLDEAEQEIYPDYPKPTLGDFGLAFKTSEQDPNNPFFWKTGLGTEGFRAPEQFPWIDQDNLTPLLQDWRVTSKADVFAVGMILRCLVLNEVQPNQPYFLGDPAAYTELDMAIPPAAVAPRVLNYSNNLRALIDSCLLFDPNQRLTFQQLLARVRIYTNEDMLDRSEGMRSGDVDDETLVRHALIGPVDAYRLGLARGYLPPPAL